MSEDSSKKENRTSVVKNRENIPYLRRFSLKHKNSKDLGSPWSVVLTAVLIFIISQFIAAILVGIGEAIAHPNASLTDALNQSAPVQFFYVLLAEGLAFFFTIRLVKQYRGMNLSAIGLGRLPRWNDAGKAILGAGAFYLLLIGVSIIVTIVAPDIDTNKTQDVGFNTLNTPIDTILAFLALVFLPPIGEETLVRGYLYSGLRMKWRFGPALLLTSLLFGAAHLGTGSDGSALWLAGIDTFILSVVLVYLREKTGALYAGMMVHAINNIIAFTVYTHGLLVFVPR